MYLCIAKHTAWTHVQLHTVCIQRTLTAQGYCACSQLPGILSPIRPGEVSQSPCYCVETLTPAVHVVNAGIQAQCRGACRL